MKVHVLAPVPREPREELVTVLRTLLVEAERGELVDFGFVATCAGGASIQGWSVDEDANARLLELTGGAARLQRTFLYMVDGKVVIDPKWNGG